MSEGDFWSNLDSFVEKQQKQQTTIIVDPATVVVEKERVDDWLKNVDAASSKSSKSAKTKSPSPRKDNHTAEDGKVARLATPTQDQPLQSKAKKQVSIEQKKKKPKENRGKLCRRGKDEDEEKERKILATRKFTRRSKLKRKRRRHDQLYFGPLVECNFNLPRVAQQLERLMGSSVVRLTDRKYMLELQKRIQEDYHDTLMKRISQRQSQEDERELNIMLNPPRADIEKFSRVLFTAQSIVLASELEREKRMGISSSEKIPKALSEHPVFAINQATNQLLMSKRSKLKTIREKNAEELIKQGKRWEMQRLQLQEQERLKEIAMKRERERKLENQTLYVFDADKVDLSGMDLLKIRSRKFTECEIDLKDFLLSEKEKTRKKMIRGGQSSEDSKRTSKSQEMVSSFETEKQESVDVVRIEEAKKVEDEAELELMRLNKENMKKMQAKKDEDPKMAQFKTAESVKEIYEIAEDLISSDVIKAQ